MRPPVSYSGTTNLLQTTKTNNCPFSETMRMLSAVSSLTTFTFDGDLLPLQAENLPSEHMLDHQQDFGIKMWGCETTNTLCPWKKSVEHTELFHASEETFRHENHTIFQLHVCITSQQNIKGALYMHVLLGGEGSVDDNYDNDNDEGSVTHIRQAARPNKPNKPVRTKPLHPWVFFRTDYLSSAESSSLDMSHVLRPQREFPICAHT